MVETMPPAGVDTLATGVAKGVETVALQVVASLPNFILAAVLLVIGLVVSWVVANLIKQLLKLVRFEDLLEVHKLEDALGKIKITNVFASMAKYYVLFLTIQVVMSLFLGPEITSVLSPVVSYIPRIIGAALLIVVAALLGELVKERLLEHGKEQYLTVVANTSKLVIVFIGAVAALDTLGFNTEIVKDLLRTVVQAAAFGIALAIGIAFGLGGQEHAKDMIKNARKQIGY